MRLLFLLLTAVLPLLAVADDVLRYEPAVVQVSGTISKGKHQHPNGTWFDVLVLKLATPASIKGDGEKDSFNVDEKNVTELQVYSPDAALLKNMGALNGKDVTLKGTLFHAHTAWHVRDLVLMVAAIK
jgi:hypothetical protein